MPCYAHEQLQNIVFTRNTVNEDWGMPPGRHLRSTEWTILDSVEGTLPSTSDNRVLGAMLIFVFLNTHSIRAKLPLDKIFLPAQTAYDPQ